MIQLRQLGVSRLSHRFGLLSRTGLLTCLLSFVFQAPVVAGVVFGDFNGDGFRDLAVGVPNQNVGLLNEAGLVRIVYGSQSGLRSGPQNQTWHAGLLGRTNQTEAHFGKVLAAADFNGDGYDDLVVGEPDRDVRSKNDGAIYIIPGSFGGLGSFNSRFVTRPGGGKFGAALTTGDFNGDSLTDLAVGSPNSLPPDLVVGGLFASHSHGMVEVLYGRSSGLDSGNSQVWSQNSTGIAGSAESEDHFGAALAAGDFNNDGFDDLAVGVPDEDLDGTVLPVYDGGAVNVIYGSQRGLQKNANQIWTQDSSGIKGEGDMFDHFGAALTVGDFNGDGYDDLAVGAPGEESYRFGACELLNCDTNDAGAVHVIFGGPVVGLRKEHDLLFIGDRSREDFGAALAGGNFNGDRFSDLVVGVPGTEIGGDEAAGAVTIMLGGPSGPEVPAFIHQDLPGMLSAADKNDRFGFALAVGDAGARTTGQTGNLHDLAVMVNDGDFAAVHVIYGGGSGLDLSGNQLLLFHDAGILFLDSLVAVPPIFAPTPKPGPGSVVGN